MALRLTQDQLQELQESFNIFDKNGDGTITPGELVMLLQSMNKPVTEQKIRDMIDAMDKDGNGKVDFREFCNHCQSTRKTSSALEKAFKEFDLDGNGFITEDELHTVMIKLGQSLDRSEIRQMIEVADKDRDGRVNYKEFIRLMTRK